MTIDRTKLATEWVALGLCIAIGCGAPRPTKLDDPFAELSLPRSAAVQAAPAPKVISVHAVGDCAIGDLHYGAGAPGSFLAKLSEVDEPMRYPFSGVRHLFVDDDLTIANLEGTLTERGAWHNPVFSIRGKPEWAAMLQIGGIDLVDIDNNHSGDYGPDGHLDTRRALEAAGVNYFGREVVDRRVIKGVNVVNLGYLGGPKGTKARVIEDVKRERKPNTIIIASFHWGVESYYATHPDQQSLGRAAIDAGADLVLGHHPHVLQGIETYRERHIVYSLGNFVFGANSQPKDTDSLIVEERFLMNGDALGSVEQTLVPVRISTDRVQNDFRPVVLEGAEAARVLDKVAKLSAAL
jgi:poly-gamma-glutamate synthesis protein (capsule biosynthesis protein)